MCMETERNVYGRGIKTYVKHDWFIANDADTQNVQQFCIDNNVCDVNNINENYTLKLAIGPFSFSLKTFCCKKKGCARNIQ